MTYLFQKTNIRNTRADLDLWRFLCTGHVLDMGVWE